MKIAIKERRRTRRTSKSTEYGTSDRDGNGRFFGCEALGVDVGSERDEEN